MDLLQMIKQDHDDVRNLVSQFSQATKVADRRELFGKVKVALQVHTQLEDQYLYPEVEGLFSGSELFVDASMANHRSMKRLMNEIAKSLKLPVAEQDSLPSKIKKLGDIIESHLRLEEDQMMPKVRVLISTQDREDLGEVFQEVREEWRKNPSLLAESSGAKSKAKRKRA